MRPYEIHTHLVVMVKGSGDNDFEGVVSVPLAQLVDEMLSESSVHTMRLTSLFSMNIEFYTMGTGS